VLNDVGINERQSIYEVVLYPLSKIGRK